MHKWVALAIVSFACVACDTKLETGYEPQKLGMSGAERRALYSDPYTSESAAAKNDQAEEAKSRRPTPTQY